MAGLTDSFIKNPAEYRGPLPKRAKRIGAPNGSFSSMASIYLPRPVKIPKKLSAWLPEAK